MDNPLRTLRPLREPKKNLFAQSSQRIAEFGCSFLNSSSLLRGFVCADMFLVSHQATKPQRFMKRRHAERVSASIAPHEPPVEVDKSTLKQVQGDGLGIGR